MLAEIRNVIAHANGYVDYLPSDKRSLFSWLEGSIELKMEIANHEDAQIILARVYRVLLF